MSQLARSRVSFTSVPSGPVPQEGSLPAEAELHGVASSVFFAGVQFNLRALGALALERVIEAGLRLPDASHACPAHDTRLRAGVARCDLLIEQVLPEARAGEAEDEAARALSWSWRADECRLETPAARALFVSDGSGRWQGSAAVAATRGSVEALLSGVAAAILYRRGGAVLHAAAVELDGGVLAFIGPSGAGKSTAARQCGARLFAVDRLALIPPRAPGLGWSACSLPGGTRDPEDPEPSQALVLPLRAVLRVRHAAGASITRASGGRALGLVRAAVFQGTRSPADEQRLLEALAALCAELPLGELHFALGSALAPAIAGWLREEAAR